MKRFVFWFAVGLLIFTFLHWVRSNRQDAEAERRTAFLLGQTASWDRRIVVRPDEPVPASPIGADVLLPDDVFRSHDGEPARELVPAEGLPVPVVPGSRVTESRAEVPVPEHRRPRRTPGPYRVETPPPGAQVPADAMVVKGRLSATEQRAIDDALGQFRTRLADTLYPDVPRTWTTPQWLVSTMTPSVAVRPVERDYGTVYEATLTVRLTPEKRNEVVQTYRREQVLKRLAMLAGLLAFVLSCLAAVSGYIKADEATRGYYTNRLRAVAAAGVGAAGVLIYRMLT